MNNENCDQIFQCICGKSFKSKRSLGIHKQSCMTYLKSIGKDQQTYICNGCHRKFETRASLQAHISHCDLYVKNPPKGMHTSKYWSNEKQMYVCECGKEFKTHQSLNAHFSMCKIHKIAIRKNPEYAKTRIRSGIYCNFSKYQLGEVGIQKIHEKRQKTIANNIKNGKQYSFNANKSRGKFGIYKGFHCDSSWELAFVIYSLDHNVSIKRCHQIFRYKYEEKWHRYYPDFELEDGTIIEIKGYWSKQWQAKLDQFPKNKKLQILGKNEMIPILDYVKSKYGNDFVKMYES